MTPKQWLYLELVLELIARGPLPPQKQMAVTLHIRPQTVSEWNRQPRFRRALMRILRESVCIGDLFADLANQRQAQQGNLQASELNLRRRGLYDPLPHLGEAPAVSGAAVAGSQVSVAFYGLPQPPTKSQAEALNPPPGSNLIITPPGLPAAPTGRLTDVRNGDVRKE